MGKHTNIEWATATWNPWMGCTKVSLGCKNCYMFRDQKRFGNDPAVLRQSKTTFRDPLKWNRPRIIFVCSWSDFFHPDVPEKWRTSAYKIMQMTPRHTYLILTKRPEQMAARLPMSWFMGAGNPYPNVWLGVSAENQKHADERIPQLLKIPAAVRFVSAEPLLGPIEINQGWFEYSPKDSAGHIYKAYRPGIHWLITGGESDFKNPRPCDLDWVRDIRDQCQEIEIPFFHKQHGGSKKINGAWGGRELDGRIWNEFPKPND